MNRFGSQEQNKRSSGKGGSQGSTRVRYRYQLSQGKSMTREGGFEHSLQLPPTPQDPSRHWQLCYVPTPPLHQMQEASTAFLQNQLLLQVLNSRLSILRRPSSKVEKIPRDSLSVPGPNASEWLTSFCGRQRNSFQRQEHMGVTIGHPFSENNSFRINYLFTFPVHLAFKLSLRERVRNFSKRPNRFKLLRFWAQGQTECTCCVH